jgi:hypothetical protein
MAHIGLFNRKLTLGLYKDVHDAAAAAAFLFVDYAGHWNDVPMPSADFIAKIEEKCTQFQKAYRG